MNDPDVQALMQRMEGRTGRTARVLGGAPLAAQAPPDRTPDRTGRGREESAASSAHGGADLATRLLVRTAPGKQGTPALSARTRGRTLHAPEKPARHKFSAVETVSDNIRFSSRLEATRYGELKTLQQAGVVLGFLRQAPFHLGSDTVYRVDFQVFWADGRVTFEDTKGRETENFRAKMRLLRDLYPWAEIHLLERA